MRYQITMGEDFHDKALKRAQEQGISFSEYIRVTMMRVWDQEKREQLYLNGYGMNDDAIPFQRFD